MYKVLQHGMAALGDNGRSYSGDDTKRSTEETSIRFISTLLLDSSLLMTYQRSQKTVDVA
jgi:hypothetical protein